MLSTKKSSFVMQTNIPAAYMFLVYLHCAFAHSIQTLIDNGHNVLLRLNGFHDVILDALDPLLVQVLQVLENGRQEVGVVLVL